MSIISRLVALALILSCAGSALADGIFNPGGSSGGATTIVSGTTPITGGADKQVLFNDGGVVNGDPALTFTKATGNLASTTYNKVTITAPATGSTLTIANGKTLTASNTITFTATDGSTLAIGAGGTLGTAAYQNTGTSGANLPFLNGANTWSGNQAIVPASANTEPLTITLGTLTANTKGVNITGTWNAAGVTFDAPLFMNITNSASAAGSMLADFQIGGTTNAALNFNSGGGRWIGGGLSLGQGSTFIEFFDTLANAVSRTVTNRYAAFTSTSLAVNRNFIFGWTSLAAGGGDSGNSANIDTFLIRATAATLQHGTADAAAPVAQTIQVQNVNAGTSNTAGANWTFKGSLSTGSGASGDIIFQTGGTGAGATAQNTATTALTIKGATQLVVLPAITTDATHTDSTVCQDTTTHALYFGSGAAGICLGTSSIRFKTDLAPLAAGLDELLRVDVVSYRYRPGYGDPARKLYGFTAEQMAQVMPELVGLDADGLPSSVDWAGVVPVLVRAIQQQQSEIEELRHHQGTVR